MLARLLLLLLLALPFAGCAGAIEGVSQGIALADLLQGNLSSRPGYTPIYVVTCEQKDYVRNGSSWRCPTPAERAVAR